jgi:hypothetical protein
VQDSSVRASLSETATQYPSFHTILKENACIELKREKGEKEKTKEREAAGRGRRWQMGVDR